jgi:hypothetical protein
MEIGANPPAPWALTLALAGSRLSLSQNYLGEGRVSCVPSRR